MGPRQRTQKIISNKCSSVADRASSGVLRALKQVVKVGFCENNVMCRNRSKDSVSPRFLHYLPQNSQGAC